MISIKGLDKAAVLAALYNHSKGQGMGFLQAVLGAMTVEQAREHLGIGDDQTKMFPTNPRGNRMYFDYLQGRVLKVDLSGDEFEERLYDRDVGTGAAQHAIDSVRSKGGAA